MTDRRQRVQAFKRKPQKTEQLDWASEGAFAWMPGPGFTARPKGRLDLWGSDLFNSRTGGSLRDVVHLITEKIGPVYEGKPPFWGRKFLLFHDPFSFEGARGSDWSQRGIPSLLRFKPLRADNASLSASQGQGVRSAATAAALRGQESLGCVPFDGL
jgi:hypothetical protein